MPQEAVVLQEGNIKERAEIASKETVRIRRVIIGILPSVKITNQKRDANSAKSANPGTERVTASPARSPRRVVEKDLLPHEKFQAIRLRTSEYPAAEIQIDFTENPKFLGSRRNVHFSKGTLRHVKIRERKGPYQGVTQHSDPHERSPYAPKFEHRSEEETLQQERCARREGRDLAINVHKVNDKDETTFCSRSEVWSLPAPTSNIPEE